MEDFINNFKTAVIGTVDEENHPFSSYAPFIRYKEHFYVYISDIATHTKNIKRNPAVSLFFIEDEDKTENLFARKRLSLRCFSKKIERESEHFNQVLDLFAQKFNASTVSTLRTMLDFNLYEFSVNSGEATFGFGKAYTVGGEKMNELIPRKSDGHTTGHTTKS
jgi:heme iron utilization protein